MVRCKISKSEVILGAEGTAWSSKDQSAISSDDSTHYAHTDILRYTSEL